MSGGDGEGNGVDGDDEERHRDADRDPDEYPIEGQVLLLTAAKASVAPGALPGLLARVQADLGPRIEEYRRRYETAHEDDERATFFVEPDHWDAVGERLGLDRRETDAVRRAHEEQLRRVGSRTDRRDEFETALELRAAAVVGRR